LKILEQHGFKDGKDAFGRIMVEGKARYVRTPSTEKAVAILRMYLEN